MESHRVLNWRPLDYPKQLKEEVVLTMYSHRVLNWRPLGYLKQLKEDKNYQETKSYTGISITAY